ncbi:IS110 family transposase [Streptomyces sp. RKND-216]|uniref:IS110 family transposase n=1 Tax=Streptomyces sp. RKND-216 TaxID=2562581 RepID=UPI002491E5B7|nr:IS110 family transposase [Streptomyces sp. RKND-216]
MTSIDEVGVFLGLDVGRTAHHGHGLTPSGKRVFDKPLPNSEPKLRAVPDELTAKFGSVLVIVDQPASIGALPLTVARDAGCQVACLPGLAVRRVADLYPGEAKTDAKDAAVIASMRRGGSARLGEVGRQAPPSASTVGAVLVAAHQGVLPRLDDRLSQRPKVPSACS